MYTGTLIEDLIRRVEHVEAYVRAETAPVKVTDFYLPALEGAPAQSNLLGVA